MDKYEYWNKCCELLEQANEKEAKLESYIQKWLVGERNISSNLMEETIEIASDQITKLRNEAEKLKLEFERLSKEEKLSQEHLESSKQAAMRLKYNLGLNMDKVIFTGGVLSSNYNESHLLGRYKSKEELEIDKQLALDNLREKVVKKEISLSQASQLKQDIEHYYTLDEEFNNKHI